MIHWFENSYLSKAMIYTSKPVQDVVVLAFIVKVAEHFLVMDEEGKYHSVLIDNMRPPIDGVNAAFKYLRAQQAREKVNW